MSYIACVRAIESLLLLFYFYFLSYFSYFYVLFCSTIRNRKAIKEYVHLSFYSIQQFHSIQDAGEWNGMYARLSILYDSMHAMFVLTYVHCVRYIHGRTIPSYAVSSLSFRFFCVSPVETKHLTNISIVMFLFVLYFTRIYNVFET